MRQDGGRLELDRQMAGDVLVGAVEPLGIGEDGRLGTGEDGLMLPPDRFGLLAPDFPLVNEGQGGPPCSIGWSTTMRSCPRQL